jgi:7-cyano-7-deazaguanine synthase
MLDLALLGQISDTALTQDREIAFKESGIPSTFVPGRNLLFFTFASAVAYRRGLTTLVGGMCETDYSGYPDCRPEFIEAFERLANLATRSGVEGARLNVHAPLIRQSKADIAREGARLGIDFAETVSCYQADDEGRACAHCDACRLRADGFAAAGLADPTRYR